MTFLSNEHIIRYFKTFNYTSGFFIYSQKVLRKYFKKNCKIRKISSKIVFAKTI